MSDLRAGAYVTATDVFGKHLARRATSGVVRGKNFPVVWVCGEVEWELAENEGRQPDAVPWPASDVKLRDALERP